MIDRFIHPLTEQVYIQIAASQALDVLGTGPYGLDFAIDCAGRYTFLLICCHCYLVPIVQHIHTFTAWFRGRG